MIVVNIKDKRKRTSNTIHDAAERDRDAPENRAQYVLIYYCPSKETAVEERKS